jgi:hypothetical protein
MMERRRCNACGGEYFPVQADGIEYYHVCPPKPDDVVAGELGLPKDPADWSPADRARFAAADRRIPGHRDENVVPGRKPGDKATLKAAGAGYTVL